MSAPEPRDDEEWARAQVDDVFRGSPSASRMDRKPPPGSVPITRPARALGLVLLLMVLMVVFGVLALVFANTVRAAAAEPTPAPSVVVEILDVDEHPVDDQPDPTHTALVAANIVLFGRRRRS